MKTGARICSPVLFFFLLVTCHSSLVTRHCCIWCEAALEFVRNGDSLKGIAADGDEDKVSFGNKLTFAFAPDFKIQPQRFCADAPDINGDLQQIVQLCGTTKVALNVCARQPHVQLVETDGKWLADTIWFN